MKAWEALEILESLDPNVEVMLTIGRAKKTEVPVITKEYIYPYVLPTQNPIPPWTITCETIQ